MKTRMTGCFAALMACLLAFPARARARADDDWTVPPDLVIDEARLLEPTAPLEGKARYKRDKRPIAAFSFGIVGLISESNPKGHSYRLDKVGWKNWVDLFMKEYYPRGWRRTMIWQVAGSYDKHRGANMVFEIGTAMCDKGKETIGELQTLYNKDVTVGLWMGRGANLSKGFDTGERWAIDVDKPEDRAIWEREIGLVHSWGIRMVGLDDVSHGPRRSKASGGGFAVPAGDVVVDQLAELRR